MNSLNNALLKGGRNGLAKSTIPESNASPLSISHVFPLQSYFDYQFANAQALIAQQQGQEIINPQPRSDSGYSIGLAPWSQTPVALKFKVGSGPGSSPTLILKPGQIVRPQGRGDSPLNFNGFEYGLPFGWFGGGLATLYIFPSARAELKWEAVNNEVLFHSQQLLTRASSAIPPTQPFYNWPTKFPWVNAMRNASAPVQQSGDAGLSIVRTTRILLRLRNAVESQSPLNCRAILWGSDEFGHQADGLTVSLSNDIAYDFVFPANNAGGVGYAFNNMVTTLPPDIFGMGGNYAGLTLDVPTGSTIEGAVVDVLRFGQLG